jgi:hypothetical protein
MRKLEKRKKEKKRKRKEIPPSMVELINCISIKHVQSQKEKENWSGGYNGLGRWAHAKTHSFQRKAPKGSP